jgi:hypothetical protein
VPGVVWTARRCAGARGFEQEQEDGRGMSDSAVFPIEPERAGATLSDRDRRILEFERQWWKYAGAKEQAIRDLFDMSGTRYYQLLNGLIDTPEALAFDPMLVKRLRRMRASRQRARSARRLGIDV